MEKPRLLVGQIITDLFFDSSDLQKQWHDVVAAAAPWSIEYQIELLASLAEESLPRPEPDQTFIGVHQATFETDIISGSKTERDIAFRKAELGLQKAHELGATYFVVHPTTRDNWQDRLSQLNASRLWVEELYSLKESKGYSPQICIENLEFPKIPSTIGEVISELDYYKSKSMDIGLIFDVAHHWHNYVHLLHQLSQTHLVDPEMYCELLSNHLRSIQTYHPNCIVGYHFAQAYINWESKEHVTHGLPDLEHQSHESSRKNVYWLSPHSVLKELLDFSIDGGYQECRLILEVHGQSVSNLDAVAQALVAFWLQMKNES